jgi:15-cis-phytoene synthase
MIHTASALGNETANFRAAAEIVMAASGKTFHQAARLLPHDVRDGVISLYAFCRYVDDLADESTESIAVRSEQLRDLQQALLEEHEREAEGALAMHARSLNLSPSSRWAASVLVGAAREDLTQTQPEDETALIRYAFGVAGTVGLMMAEILGARKEGKRAAIELGIAMQLSNIARDVAQDFRAGRIYLPASWITRIELECALMKRDQPAQERLEGAMLRLLRLADELYERAFTGFWTLPLRVRWSILSAALCYREIGIYVGRDRRMSWQRRTIVPRWRKLTLVVIAAMRLLRPKYWRAQQTSRSSKENDLLNGLPIEILLAEAAR